METGDGGSLTCKGTGVDVCRHGLGLLVGYPLVRGMVLRLRVPVEGTDSMLPVFAEVAWVTPLEDCFRAGMRLLG